MEKQPAINSIITPTESEGDFNAQMNKWIEEFFDAEMYNQIIALNLFLDQVKENIFIPKFIIYLQEKLEDNTDHWRVGIHPFMDKELYDELRGAKAVKEKAMAFMNSGKRFYHILEQRPYPIMLSHSIQVEYQHITPEDQKLINEGKTTLEEIEKTKEKSNGILQELASINGIVQSALIPVNTSGGVIKLVEPMTDPKKYFYEKTILTADQPYQNHGVVINWFFYGWQQESLQEMNPTLSEGLPN